MTEVGLDLAAFPSEKHFVSWLRLAPRTAIAGGRPLQRSKSALGAAFRRKARHKGASVAIFCIARKLATLVYRMLRWGQDYVDIGEDAYEVRYRSRTLANLAATAKSLGYILLSRSNSDHQGN